MTYPGWESGGDSSLVSRPHPGFSIDSGKSLVRAEELSFVAGAPRANHKGAVVILRKDSASRLVPEVMLSGERLTSGFGYSLAVADLITMTGESGLRRGEPGGGWV